MILYRLRDKLLKEIINVFDGKNMHAAMSLPEDPDLSGITISEPKNKSFGDITTNAALVLSPLLKKDPMQIAGIIEQQIIDKWEECQGINIAKPGFINMALSGDWIKSSLPDIAKKYNGYGKNNSGNGIKTQIEFVSANPTGDLHIGHGRWAALGDTLANIYEANGYGVQREYYVNDYGSQIKNFAECLKSIYLKKYGISKPYPQDGYPESLVRVVADEIIKDYGDKYVDLSSDADADVLGKIGVRIMIDKISDTLRSMGVVFDNWFLESSMYEGTNFEKMLAMLKEKGLVYEKDDAAWFRSEQFGDDKDRVVIRANGEPTYFASDIMYLLNKVERGFKKIIYILGADHHGYVKRLTAIGKSTGFDEKELKIIIGQLVNLLKDGQAVKMSKRKGEVYNLGDLLKEVGKDAVRFFFTSNSFDTPMDFDISLAVQKSNQNPVYYVQYAHARISSIFEKIAQLYRSSELIIENKDLDGSIFSGEYSFDAINDRLAEKMDFKDIGFKSGEDIELIKMLLFFPDIVKDSCAKNEPYLINQYIYKLAASFHYFYKHCRIIDDNKLDGSRLKLIILVRIVLANAFRLLNIDAPLKM